MQQPEISIIIRTYNEEKYLPLLLDALDEQNFRNFEAILVDSGSIDNTCAIADGRVDQLLRIEKHDFTFGYALNIGAKAAKGKFLVMVSAHTKPETPSWLENLVAPLRSGDVAMSYGRQIGWETSKFGEAVDFYRVFGLEKEELVPPHFFANNANSAVRSDLWKEHPFDEKLPGLEDAEFAKHWMSKGFKVIYEPEACLHHIHEETWPQVHRRYFREAVAARVMGMFDAKDSPSVFFRESFWLLDDLRRLLLAPPAETPKRFNLRSLKEIARFRYYKARGTIEGLLSDETIQESDKKDAYFFERSSRAVIIEGPNKAHLETVPLEKTRPGEVLLRVEYVGVGAAELEMLEGPKHSPASFEYPMTPGREFSATVAALGQNIRHLEVGDRVVVEGIQSCGTCSRCNAGDEFGCHQKKELGIFGQSGGYSDYVTVPGKFVHKLPADADMVTATLCEPIAIALKGLRKLERFTDADNLPKACTIVGGGSLGHVVAKVMEYKGYRVHVIDRNPKKLDLFANTSITGSSDFNHLEKCDIVIEATGDAKAMENILHNTSSKAIILTLGLPYAHHSFTIDDVTMFEKTLLGSIGCRKEDIVEAIDLLSKLNLEPYVQNIFSLDRFHEAWEQARHGNTLKAILRVASRSETT